MPKSQDIFTLWVISGIVGVVIRDFYSFLAKSFGLTKYFIWTVGADIFIESKEFNTLQGHLIGFISDLVIGGTLGVLIGLALKWFGPKNYWLKGLGVGLFAWLAFFGVLLQNLPHMSVLSNVPATTEINAFVEHAIFGLVTAWTYLKLTSSRALAEKRGQK